MIRFWTKIAKTRSWTVLQVLRTDKSMWNQNFFSTKPDLKIADKINVFSVSLLAVPIATFCLGTWQVKRRKWKLGLIKNLEMKLNEEPVNLPYDLDDLSEMEYRKVVVKGKFDHSKEIYISPRSRIVKGDAAEDGRGLLSSSSSTGSFVITPFHLEDRELTILVNRGWIPGKNFNPRTRLGGQIEDTAEFIGVIRKSDRPAPFVPNNDPRSKIWHTRDIQAMSEALHCSPVFLDADHGSTIADGPIGGQTRVSLRNEHLSYIITWYSLSILTAYMWYKKFYRYVPK